MGETLLENGVKVNLNFYYVQIGIADYVYNNNNHERPRPSLAEICKHLVSIKYSNIVNFVR